MYGHDLRVIEFTLENEMLKMLTGAVAAITLATGAALAQAPTPAPAPTAPAATPAVKAPAATTAPVDKAPAVMLDAATEAKFKAIDKDNSGVLDGAELAAFKADLAKIDTDKDGKISRAEFGAAVKSGIIK